MRKLLSACLVLSFLCASFAATAFDQDSLAFPESWVGEWEGTLRIYQGPKEVKQVPMKMTIKAADSTGHFSWSTVYGGQESVEKPYTLKTIDAEKGYYLVDEHNSIKIESYFFSNNKLLSWYDVQGSLILASYEMRGKRLVFEIFAGKGEAVSKTGNSTVEGEEIPEVATYPIGVYQVARLRRAGEKTKKKKKEGKKANSKQ